MPKYSYGAIIVGGTNFKCAIGDKNGKIITQTSFKTNAPEETLDQAVQFFNQHPLNTSLGIGTFGPINADPNSKKYGFITDTPKPDWSNTNIKKYFEDALNIKVIIDKDTNCEARGEYEQGIAQNISRFFYISVGTGIGGSLFINGKAVGGAEGIEVGHIRVPLSMDEPEFKGVCNFHGNCMEGLASGNALRKRAGILAENIQKKDIWKLEAEYLGLVINNVILTTSPELVVIGGRVMRRKGLLGDIQSNVLRYISHYKTLPEITSYIKLPADSYNGLHGALSIAISGKVT